MLTEEKSLPAGGGPLYCSRDAEQLLLTVRIGTRRFALPAHAVERILPMASLLPLPQAGEALAGLLNLQGSILPVIDPRPPLDISRVGIGQDQRLVLVSGQYRYLLWVDGTEQLQEVQTDRHEAALSAVQGGLIAGIARLPDETIPVLSVDALYSWSADPKTNLAAR